MSGRGPDEVLLGFDAREPRPRSFPPPQFLLRTDLESLLSADTMVWPSLLPNDYSPDTWTGMNGPFWEDLSAVRSAIPESHRHPGSYQLIAATWHTDIGFEAEERTPGKILGPHRSPTTPPERDDAWRCLGFDITDPQISGLCNCGYDESERQVLPAQWGPCLNRHHLFDRLEHAFAFRQLTNSRVPEHAPFFVLGLWLLETG